MLSKERNSAPSNVIQDWELLRTGNVNGLDGIFRHFFDELFQYGLSMVYHPDFIQDCIQDVFIDLWKYHKNLQRVEHVKSYLIKSLNHKIFREIKKIDTQINREKVLEIESSLFHLKEGHNEISYERDEKLQKKLAMAICELPQRQREIIHYLFFEDISYEEASKLMGINLRSVYTLAWKAISSLKKSLIIIFLSILFQSGVS